MNEKTLQTLKTISDAGPHYAQTPYDRQMHWRTAPAQWLWSCGERLAGTPAQTYLQARGIDVCPAELRYLSSCPAGIGTQQGNHPTMLAALRDDVGLVAIEQSFLTLDGQLADIAQPKRLLGFPARGLGRWGMTPQTILRLADSVEEAASAMIVGTHGIPVWPVFGAARYRQIDIPAGIKHIIIYASRHLVMAEAIVQAASHLRANGRSLSIEYPPDHESWNAYLLGVRS